MCVTHPRIHQQMFLVLLFARLCIWMRQLIPCVRLFLTLKSFWNQVRGNLSVNPYLSHRNPHTKLVNLIE